MPFRLIKYLRYFENAKKPYIFTKTPKGIPFIGKINDFNTFFYLLIPNSNSHILNLLNSKMEAKSVFLDIGANVGLIGVNIAKSNEKCNVYAFEPYPDTFIRAAATIALNELNNMEIFQLALGDSEGEISFNFPYGHSGGASALPIQADSVLGKPKYDTIKVRCTTLDSFVEERKIPHVDLMKIDVEGYEPNVLRGAKKVIARDAPSFLYEYNHLAAAAGWNCRDIEKIIQETGRKYKYSVLHQNGELTEYPPKDGEDVDIFAECVG